jgi:hypothetical protein
MFHGVNSVLLFVLITYLCVCSSAGRKNFWILSRETILCLTTPGISTPWLNMAHIMSIRMRWKLTSIAMGIPSNYKTTWYYPPTCPTITWWVPPLIKREWWRPLLWPMRTRGRRWCLDPLSGVVLVVFLLSTTWCIPHIGVSSADHKSSRIGQSPTIPTTEVPTVTTTTTTTTTAIPLCSYSTTTVGCLPATTTASRQQLSMLKLQEYGALCSWMLLSKAKQLNMSSSTHSQSTEGSCTTNWLWQLYHHGWDSHGRRSAIGYVHPQQTSYYHTVWF